MSICLFMALALLSVPQARRTEVLFDFLRSEERHEEPKLSPREEELIFDRALGAAWRRGGAAPHIGEVVRGSFTRRGARETAYVVRGGDPSPRSTIDMQNDSRLVVFDGERTVFNSPFYGVGVLRVTDLDRDGVNELLLQGGWVWMGESATTARLVVVSGGRLRVIRDFGRVASDTCEAGADGPGGRRIWARISYLPAPRGKLPRFRVRFQRGKC